MVGARLILLLSLAGCAGDPYRWEYVGPDRSAKTIGPIFVTESTLASVCKSKSAFGCISCTKTDCVIYILDGMNKSWTRYAVEHEWKHAKGWIHN